MVGLLDEHAGWLEARGLDVEVAVRLGVRSHVYRSQSVIAFPYLSGERELYAKVRFTDQKKMRCDPEGVAQTRLWNQDALLENPGPREELIITEGEPDAIAVAQIGKRFVVSRSRRTTRR